MDSHLDDESQTSSEIAVTWNSPQEILLASIADRANCSRWMHSRCQTIFDNLNFYLTIPSIAVSTLAGSATIGLPGLIGPNNPELSKWLTTGIGLFTLSTGVLTSINQYIKTAQLSEGHRVAALAYGKLHRCISYELALRRDQRITSTDFIKTIRSEQDRLQDTSPTILENIILEFRKEFDKNIDLEKPEIAGDLDHVQINKSTKHSAAIITPLLPNLELELSRESTRVAESSRLVDSNRNLNIHLNEITPHTEH